MSSFEINDPAHLEAILNWPAYGLTNNEKRKLFNKELLALTQFHYEQCPPYKILIDKFGIEKKPSDIEHSFALPVRLFKNRVMMSVPDNEVVKTLLSSGTGGKPSTIVLDKNTSLLQTKILSKIVTDLIGKDRLPMLVIDCPSTVKGRYRFSARTAGILGFSMYGRDITYALNDDMTLNMSGIEAWLSKNVEKDLLLFGFTYIIWLHFLLALEQSQLRLPLERGLLIHGGGWKKIIDQSVDKNDFKRRINAVTGLKRIYNYYGMVEQTGSIFMECQNGRFHASSWSDILIRDEITHEVLPYGERGLIELLSLIPRSYPGHVLLSEDIGRITGIDDCSCGRFGVYFEVEGRLLNAEIRGCSDTYTQ